MTRTEQDSGTVFHGWWVVLVAAIGLSMGYGPIITFTFGVFFKPLSQEFGWNRAQVSLAFSLSLLVMSIAFPFVGRLVDRFGARRVIVPSVLLFGFGLISFSLLSARLWHLYAIYLVLGVVGGGTAPVPYSNVISHWFDKRRGLALGLAMVGLGLSTFALFGANPYRHRRVASDVQCYRPHGHGGRHSRGRAVSHGDTADAGVGVGWRNSRFTSRQVRPTEGGDEFSRSLAHGHFLAYG